MIRSTSCSRLRAAAGLLAFGMLCAALVVLPGSSPASAQPVGPALFDDFNYTGYTDPRISQHGWTLRSGQGGPGVPGATWRPQNFTFGTESGNSIMTMRSGTSGTASTTQHTEIYHQRKFHYGTYAARVRFSDVPVTGPDGDRMVQTFFTISPLNFPLDPAYSELDFEYLPNGGWGRPSSALLASSWETYSETPPAEVHTTTEERASFAGWHNLVITVDTEAVTYYLDGRLFARHTEPYLPESSMSIRFNQWLINLTGISSRKTRMYEEKVDYVYFAKEQILTPAEVTAAVTDYRTRGVTFEDTVF
ncbi:glycoside hydrolase family 16 protein [Streptomyces sp. NBC_00286]|uniref:glycoside hydrolase family 16 protein n=1 Tax=Streptomyces sp. NBC_00286 TaxID=2975701 RepID=UPI002E282C7D|nr:glycoside hydrolase family 16 protein [Streptomyces sp. NBC_00286]